MRTRARREEDRIDEIHSADGEHRRECGRAGLPCTEREVRCWLDARADEPCAGVQLDDASRVVRARRGDMLFARQGRGKARERCTVRKDHIARGELTATPAREAVIATIGLDARAVGVNQIELRCTRGAERERRLEEDASVGKHVDR